MQAGFSTTDRSVAALFAHLHGAQGMVLAALDGMGRVWVDSPVHPRCAIAAAGDFLFCGGEPGLSAARMLRTALASEKRSWLVQAVGDWAEVLKKLARVRPCGRWAFDHHVQPEDTQLRRLLACMPENAVFQPITGEWIAWCRQFGWSEDFVSMYEADAFERKGLGVLLMIDGVPVAGAGSYVSYPGGVEIQLQTRDDMQGRGYATLAAAKLVLMAHERGLIATWDAANETSAHIAQKLGYRLLGPYQVYELEGEA